MSSLFVSSKNTALFWPWITQQPEKLSVKKNNKLCFLIGNRYWSKSIKYFLILFEFQNWIIFFWITVVELSHCRVWKRVSLVFVSPFQIRFFLSKTPRPTSTKPRAVGAGGARGAMASPDFGRLDQGSRLYPPHNYCPPSPTGFLELPTALHYTYQLHAADGCNNSKFRLYEKATYQRGVRNSRLGVKNSSFFVEHHFSHNCKKKHFSTTANSVYLDFNRIWKKSLPMRTQVGWNIFGAILLIFFLIDLSNLFMSFQFI